MTTLKEWIRDFKKISKWGKIALVIAIISLIITIIGLSYSLITDYLNNKSTQRLLEEVNQIKIEISQDDDEKFNNRIFEETGFTYDEIKQKAEKLKEISDSYYHLGLAYSTLEDFDKAIEFYDKALEKDSKNGDIWNSKGVALLLSENIEEASRSFDKASEFWNKNCNLAACVLNNKGIVNYELGKYNEALYFYNEAIKLNPYFTKFWNNKGVTLAHTYSYDEALIAFDKALELDPKNVEAWMNKGNTYGELNKCNESLEAYNKALELDPKHEDTIKNKQIRIKKCENPLGIIYPINQYNPL